MDKMSDLQARLARWQTRNFGAPRAELLALGVAEESGELCHAILKRAQGIRGQDDDAAHAEAVADAIADVTIYAMQLATLYGFDFGTLVESVANKVMSRDWNQNKCDGR